MSVKYPVITGQMSETSFYSTCVLFTDLESISFVSPEVQRHFSPARANQIAEYLVSNAKIWLPPITLATPAPLELDKQGKIAFGTRLSVVDGQHRRAGIIRALNGPLGHAVAHYSVPVVILPSLPLHLQGQFFADVNGTAVAVNKTLRMSKDYRDPVILLTRDALVYAGLQGATNYLSSRPFSDKHFAFSWICEANRYLVKALNTDRDNTVRIIGVFWRTVHRILEPYWGKSEYLCSSATVLGLLGKIGAEIITEENFPAMLWNLNKINWSRIGGDFKDILVSNEGKWIRTITYKSGPPLTALEVVRRALPSKIEV